VTRIAAMIAASAIAIALLWLAPLVGLVAVAILLAIVPPWGRTLAERFLISVLVLVGAAAIVFPRAGSTPIDALTARGFLAALLIIGLVLYAIPSLRQTPIPRPRWTDLALLALAGGLFYWLIGAYLGANTGEVLSGLFFSGWDNSAHFTTFANTYTQQSTTWVTADGSGAWNQWYPSLHTTLWALGEYALGSTGLSRIDLLFPYVSWSAISFAIAMTALAWIASDLAGLWARTVASKRVAQAATLIAAAGTASWILFGSPQLLFNAGFTNFTMGVSIVAAASYLSIRSTTSARTLGWFLIPLAGVAVIGLWTPLALGLIPAGVIVAVSLIRWKALWGVIWLVVTAATALLLAWQQLGAILTAGDNETSAADFATTIGSVPTGMAPFNIGAALAAPFVAIAIAVIVRSRRPLAWGIAGPSVFLGLLTIAFIPGTDAAGTSRIQSYYVLKSLDAVLLVTAPLITAAIAVALILVLRSVKTLTAIAATVAAALLAVTAFGYVGSAPTELSAGFRLAPGIEAGRERAAGVTKTFVADEILTAVAATADLPDFAPMNWNGSGTLPNLWAGTLHGTLSTAQQSFYLSIPPVPYGEDAVEFIKQALDAFPELKIAIVYTDPASGQFLNPRLGTFDPQRLVIRPT